MAGKLVDLTDDNFSSEVINSDTPVLVDFWAPWCPPCRQISPLIEQLAIENQGTCKVVKVNIEDCPLTTQRYDIASIPTLMIFKGGEVIERMQGTMPKAKLQLAINTAAG